MRELIEEIVIKNEYLADEIMTALKKHNSDYEFDVLKERNEHGMVNKVTIQIIIYRELLPTEKKVGY